MSEVSRSASSSIEIKVSYLKALRADSGDIDVHGEVADLVADDL